MSDRTGTGAVGNTLESAKKAGDAAQQAASQARQAGSEAAGHAKDVAHEAKDRAASLAGEAKNSALSAAEAQKDQLADQVDSLAHSIHRSGQQLEGEQDWIARVVERGAAELGSVADTLRTNDLQGIARNLEGLARRQPALFLGASVIAGFALARIGKVAVTGASSDTPTSPPKSTSPSSGSTRPAPPSQSPAASAPASAASPLPNPGIIHERS